MSLMHPITVYNATTGLILWTQGATFGDESAALSEGEAWLAGSYSSADFRIDVLATPPVPVMLPELVPTIAVNLISNIPPGTVAIIDGAKYVVGQDGQIEFDLEQPQDMRIALLNPEYRASSVLFTVPCEP